MFGAKGIIPVRDFLSAVQAQVGLERFWYFPSLAWLSAEDPALIAFAAAGIICAILCFCGIGVRLCLIAMWILYLSIVSIGTPFMSFQWDSLLLETGFLTIFLSSGKLWAPVWKTPPDAEPPANNIVVILYRLLLFRLMFLSGAVKLLSGDAAWLSLTALEYHFWTQPLPTPAGWLVGQMPAWFHRLSVAMMFFIEMIVPFAIVLTRPCRIFAGICFVILQVLIAITGNYAFFNLLTLALCLLLFDDQFLRQIWKRIPEINVEQKTSTWATRGALALAIVLGSAGLCQIVETKFDLPEPLKKFKGTLEHLNIVNGYGLFAVMTTSRPEIAIEGSLDGDNWVPYVFKYKPGPLDRAPPLVAPLQPRLDWQMWFAALGDLEQNTWLLSFVRRLLQNEPTVVGLLQTNPFPDKPPKYIRATVYDYRFSDFKTLIDKGQWWISTERHAYMPPVSLK